MPEKEFPAQIDKQKLEQALAWAFVEPDPEHLRRTRAVVVIYDGVLIGERYAEGYTKDTPLLGWSMTKSVTNALIGILVGQEKLSVDKSAPVPEWKKEGDPRGKITLDHLLRMNSGLEFKEEYEEEILSDCNIMLFLKPDMGAYAASKPLVADPGTKWSYSSGTANIISRIVRHTVTGTQTDYFAFPRRSLFDKIGMESAVMEPDASGTFVGSSYMYATARDWARFGLLFLNDGVWEGSRILPEGWVKYSTTPTPTALPGEAYGAQFWLNTDSAPGKNDRWMPKLPEEVYSACGHDGQYVTIIPSKKIVVVRLGLTAENEKGYWDHEQFLVDILASIKE
jgi:CubicO group peptidase (beta-lactamase class C family)